MTEMGFEEDNVMKSPYYVNEKLFGNTVQNDKYVVLDNDRAVIAHNKNNVFLNRYLYISKHKLLLGIIDTLIILSGFVFSFWFVFDSGLYQEPKLYPHYFVPSLLIISVILLMVSHLDGLYKYQSITNPIHQIQLLLRCYWRVLSVFILIVFFLKTEHIADSRLTIGLGFLASFLVTVIVRTILIPYVYFYLVRKGVLAKRTLIIGAGEHGASVCRQLQNNPRSYFDVVGFCDDDFAKIGQPCCDKTVLGTSYELEPILAKYNVKEVIIAISEIRRARLLDLIDRVKSAGIGIHVISGLLNEVNDKIEAEEYGGLRTYRIVPRSSHAIGRTAKRLLDLMGAALLLVILSPLFAVIAWAIKRDSPGPVFYKCRVAGKNGVTFMAYKFRSMISGNGSPSECSKYEEGKRRHLQFMKDFIRGQANGQCFVKDEARITRIGRFLRRYSLDELPQLLNVFRGEMSLVGPRFCSPEEYQFYKPWHKRRLQAKPGMTGLWQVRARSAVSYDDMVMLDLYYIDNWSLLFDIEILLRTIPVVLYGRGSRIEKTQLT